MPALAETDFAVFGLGDSSYENFCQTGKDFDSRLAQLGGRRLLDRVDADVDYQTRAKAWRESVVARLKQEIGETRQASSASVAGQSRLAEVERYSREQPLVASSA